jgi:hypothetical protein
MSKDKQYSAATIKMVDGESIKIEFDKPAATIEGAIKNILASRYIIKEDKAYLTDYVVSIEGVELK